MERRKSMANQWMWAICLQHARITCPRPQDKEFHPFSVQSFNEADVHFLAIALRRLRAVVATIEHIAEQWGTVGPALQSFDHKLPWLKRLRDVFEHLEDYAVDSSHRRSSTSRQQLQVWSGSEKTVQSWLGYDIDWNQALDAAQELYSVVNPTCKEEPDGHRHHTGQGPAELGAVAEKSSYQKT